MIEPQRISINISQQAETNRLRERIAGVDAICKKFSDDVGPMQREDVKQLRRLATYFSPNLNGVQREGMADYLAFEKEMNMYCGSVTTWPLEWQQGAKDALFKMLGDMINEDKPAEWSQMITADPAYRFYFDSEQEVKDIFTHILNAIRIMRFIVREALKLTRAKDISKAFSQYIAAPINGDCHRRQAASDEQIEALFTGAQIPGGRLLWLGSLKDAITFTRYVFPKQENGRPDYKAFEKHFFPFGRYVHSSNDKKNDDPAFVKLIESWKRKIFD